MILQCIAIALLLSFPPIATYFPEYLQEVARSTPVEIIKDDAPSLEQDTMEKMQEQSDREGESGEADRSKPSAPSNSNQQHADKRSIPRYPAIGRRFHIPAQR
jgi:hypothetical protein